MKISIIAWIIFSGVMVGLVLAYVLVTTSIENKNTSGNVLTNDSVEDSNNEFIYTTTNSQDNLFIYGSILTDLEIQNARQDCESRGGQFDLCASPCSAEIDVCIQVCAYACASLSEF